MKPHKLGLLPEALPSNKAQRRLHSNTSENHPVERTETLGETTAVNSSVTICFLQSYNLRHTEMLLLLFFYTKDYNADTIGLK